MPETKTLLTEVGQLRREVDDQGTLLDAIGRWDPGLRERRKEILEEMRNDEILRGIYLLINGGRSQKEIRDELDAPVATVSRKFSKLCEDYGIIALVDRDSRGKIYQKTRLGRVLKLERDLK